MSDFEKFYVEYADERFTREEMKAIYDGMVVINVERKVLKYMKNSVFQKIKKQ